MSKLKIIATAPIRLDRDVAGGEVLATVDTEHSLPTLLMMLQTEQAQIVAEGELEPDHVPEPGTKANASIDGNFATALEAAGVNDRARKLLFNAGVKSVDSALIYLRKHGGTFEGIRGIGETTNAEILSVVSPQ